MSQRVISVIAAQTVLAISEVAALGTTLAEAAVKKLGRPSLAQGIDTQIDGMKIDITARLIAAHGCRIPDVALSVQKKVKDAVEAATGCHVQAVHVIIQDVAFADDSEGGEANGQG